MNTTVTIYLSLGCNRGDCRRNLARAAERLAGDPRIQAVKASSLYLTEPVGGVEQPDFLNLVLEAETTASPRELLELCREVEVSLGGRENRVPMGPRAMDIDILLYGEERLQASDLVIPRPRMRERAFVLVPLAEIAPGAWIPGDGTVREALEACSDESRVEKLGSLEVSRRR